jgi:ribosome maturation factor RimP
MNRTAVTAKIEEIAERVAQPEGLEIVEVDLKGAGRHQVLLLVIDRAEGGVSHGDCELISHKVGDILDTEDVIKGTYSLEVSSPGVERKLLKWKDWERFVGEKVKVVLREIVVPAPAKYFDGVIARADAPAQAVTVTLADGAEVTFPFGQVDRANLKFEW